MRAQMVAQPQVAPRPNLTMLQRPRLPGPGVQPRNYRPAVDDSDDDEYDLQQIAEDRSKLIVPVVDFLDNVLVAIDRLSRMKPDPAKPYLQIGTVTPTQYTHSLMSDFLNKGIPYLLNKGVDIRYPADM